MLKPDSRSHLLELLRPPVGFDLDQAVGTTFSLDLLTALTVPLSFALFDWEHDDGKLREDPLALLEALRSYGDKLTVFCQAGRLRLPKKYPALVAWLESSIFEATPKNPLGLFHPKVWALRFAAADGAVCYRLLCLTRNLTFDRCWDTAVVLDGALTDRQLAYSVNNPLGDFFAELPRLARRALPDARRKAVARVADELRRVDFKPPDGFESFRFWHGGLSTSQTIDWWQPWDNAVVVAPFLSDDFLTGFATYAGKMYLVSRLESLQALLLESLKPMKGVYTIESSLETEDAAQDEEAAPREVLEGLHAKLFVCDRGWNTSVFTGSFNATIAAFYHNVEFMVELVGKKSRFGVQEFLAQSKAKEETRFADLLSEYHPTEKLVETDDAALKLEKLLDDAQRAIAGGEFRLRVEPAEEAAVFNESLRVAELPEIPCEVGVRAWPITLSPSAGKPLEAAVVFQRMTNSLITPFIAFELTARLGESERRHSFVLNLPLEGAPADRFPKLLAALLANKEQLLRYLLFMLASSNEGDSARADLVKMLTESGPESKGSESCPFLFESLLRTLHRNPAQLDRVARLLEELGRTAESSNLLSEDFKSIWEPIWKARQKMLSR